MLKYHIKFIYFNLFLFHLFDETIYLIINNASKFRIKKSIYETLSDLVSFVQFKNVKNNLGGVLRSKSNTPTWVQLQALVYIT